MALAIPAANHHLALPPVPVPAAQGFRAPFDAIVLSASYLVAERLLLTHLLLRFLPQNMGSYCSIHNDTEDETVMVYVGANPKVIKPILYTLSGFATMLSGAAAWGIINAKIVEMAVAEYTLVITASAVASATGGFVSSINWALESLQNKLVTDLSRGGYSKLLPGQTYTTGRKPIALNMRAWVIRIRRLENAIVIQRANSSVWTSRRPGGITTYSITDREVFSKWRTESIPIEINVSCDDDGDGGDEQPSNEGFTVVRSGQDFRFVEDTEESWIQVDEVRD